MYAKRAMLHGFYLFPMNRKKMFFSAYEGKQYACNPKALFLYMKKNKIAPDYTFVWEFNGKSRALEKYQVRCCRHNSLSYFYHILTSHIIITNSGVTPSIPLRKGQICVNTWHAGGAFKKFGADISGEMNGTDAAGLAVAAKQTDYFISSNHLFAQVVGHALLLPQDKVLETGLPRNDLFFDRDRMDKVRKAVRRRFQIAENAYLILYAPTYRGSSGEDLLKTSDRIDEDLAEAIRAKTGREPVFFLRRHYYHKEAETYRSYVDVSAYPDMQDLLAAADMLITDYSSAMWDFALTGRPCLLYVSDLDSYTAERGFYTSPDTWPGILCRDRAALTEAVRTFDTAAYQEKIASYFAMTGSREVGQACQKVCETLFGSQKSHDFDL